MNKKYFKIFFGVFIILAITRFIPHPPNFTSAIALSFYVPAFLGTRYLPAVLFSYVLTDIFIGFHQTIFFTWGSIVLIGLISKFYANTLIVRVKGVFLGLCIFFLVTNFGVWTLGNYGYNFQGLINCYTAAIPFFGSSIISTIVYGAIIELLHQTFFLKKKKI